MLSAVLQKALNEQINKEFYSAYLYLAMSAHFEDANLSGFAKWMKLQADEEQEHGMKFYSYLLERGANVDLTPIAGPVIEGKSNLEIFKQVQAHEAVVTASINALYELALKENDYPTQIMLQWFITEQVEEEKNAADIVAKLDMIQDKGTAVLILDQQLGYRGSD
ncbi:MAG: ferritin [Chloroflexi bacterium HGW-Chloroflexi-5]|jgi:ferritin|nr:MAG: ferritin [Chloroflexi bacterium HGW-Chloroflexi-5]